MDKRKDEVEEFIVEFLYKQNNDHAAVILHDQFRSGYCYHFAYMLRDTFHRGVVCWAAPFGHIVWKDINGKYYDVEGELTDSEAFYFIPVWYLGEHVRDFLHINTDGHPGATKQDIINIMKRYCHDNNIEYDETAEKYLAK